MLEAWAKHCLESGEDCHLEEARLRFLDLLAQLGLDVSLAVLLIVLVLVFVLVF